MTQTTHRSAEQLDHHYKIEKELAQRLYEAPPEQRGSLYQEVYDELFQRVPDHPQIQRKKSPEETRHEVGTQMSLLGKFLFPSATYLEIGPGDCSIALEVARRVDMVYAVDVSSEISAQVQPPDNFQLLLSNGTDIPLPPGTVDIAYSNQLMEHLHPDDARAQLSNIARALKTGGKYLCLTPNRLSGPHDVSRGFDAVATGFHLKEYTFSELASLLEESGFERITPLFGFRGRFWSGRPWVLRIIERSIAALPGPLRQKLGGRPPLRGFLGLNVLAQKAEIFEDSRSPGLDQTPRAR